MLYRQTTATSLSRTDARHLFPLYLYLIPQLDTEDLRVCDFPGVWGSREYYHKKIICIAGTDWTGTSLHIAIGFALTRAFKITIMNAQNRGPGHFARGYTTSGSHSGRNTLSRVDGVNMYAKVSCRQVDEIRDIALSPLALSHVVTF
jgi:hypothetical protein